MIKKVKFCVFELKIKKITNFTLFCLTYEKVVLTLLFEKYIVSMDWRYQIFRREKM